MHTFAAVILGTVLFLSTSTAVFAQETRFLAGLKGGATVENSEDGLTGTVPAVGTWFSVALNPRWRAELEIWVPQYLKDNLGEPKHRDVLISGSVVRMFTAGTSRPFVLAGLSFSRTQDWFTFCTAPRTQQPGGGTVLALVGCDEPDVIERRRERNDGADGYLLLGGGIEIPVGRRLSVVADVRASVAPVSVLLRPGVGVAFRF